MNGRIGAAYEELFAGSLDEQTERLAYHYYRSDDQAKAITYLEAAAERATAKAARAEAAELLRRAIKVSAKLGDSAAESRARAQLEALAPAQ